ncbi:MAG: T9SS type A sorting domain-containing protein [Bacteroidota bacterium]
MKLTKTIFFIILFSFFFFGKNYSQCSNDALHYINANQIRAASTIGGDLFWNRSDGQFLVPYTAGPFQEVSSIFVNGLWLTGLDAANNLKVAAQMYGNANGQTDYFPGPLNDNTGEPFNSIFDCTDFQRVWKITRGDILMVKNDFADNGMIDQPLPYDVQTWPARGNPFIEPILGFTLPDQDLAPFFDNDNDGLYDPMKGDHPVLDETLPDAIPDEMTWCVFNDVADIHGESAGFPLGVEVQLMVYAFNCSDNDVLNHSLFVRHKVINKSQENLFDFRMGYFTDMDLGCYTDDFFGCDTTLNTQYFYNSENIDGDALCTGIGTYGENPPVQAATFLNHKLANLMYFNNGGFGNVPPGTTDPNQAIEFYNFMNSIWLDGTPLTTGGNGYNPSGVPVNHAFPDNPNDPFGWTMMSANLPFADRRTVSSVAPSDLPPGGQFTLDIAYSFHRQPGADHLENVDVALSEIPNVQAFYDNGFSNECMQAAFCETDCVWPGDAGNDGIAKNDDLLYIGVSMGKAATGNERDPASTLWMAHNADNWGTPPAAFPDPKHQDCNGDGAVDELDYYILQNNYGEERPGYTASDIAAPFAEGEIIIKLNKEEVSANDNFLQRRVKGDIFLGTTDTPVDEIYGVAFTVKYDAAAWEPFPDAIVDLEGNSFFGTEDEVMTIGVHDEEAGRMDIAFSRKDGQPVTNVQGRLAVFNLILNEDVATGNPNGMQTFAFEVCNARGVDADGNFFQLGATSDVVVGTDLDFDDTLSDAAEKLNEELPLNIFPNPNNGSFDLFFGNNNSASQIFIYDFSGKNIYSEKIPVNTEQLNVDLKNKLIAGIYFIKWTLNDGQFVTKKIVVN